MASLLSRAAFSHRNYSLVNEDRFVRNADAPPLTKAEDAEALQEIARFIEAKITLDLGYVPIQIPEDETPSTSILASPDWLTATKILIIIQNAPVSYLGIVSRSIIQDEGIRKGSWLPYLERASAAGYAVLLLRPNTNTVTVETPGEASKKQFIKGSETPEIHALNVWENIIPRAEQCTTVALLSYGHGASLSKDLFLRQMVNSTGPDSNKIKAIVAIEASKIAEDDDAADTKDALNRLAINMECSPAPRGTRLAYRKDQLGCTSISLGLPAGVTEVTNVASAVSLGIDAVFRYLTIAESGGNVSKNYSVVVARDNGLDANTAVVLVNPNASEAPALTPQSPMSSKTPPPAAAAASASSSSSSRAQPPAPAQKGTGFFSRMFGGGGGGGGGSGDKPASGKAGSSQSARGDGAHVEEKLSVADFDLLKIVGKGAFGKVMLVRKKSAQDEGKIYAMKVLKKSVIAAKGQIEHTKSERDILFEVRHPYIVRLRFAFQSEDKLYLVTDYYNGGTLFYHLRKSRHFTEERARFYGAELLSALDHLHQQNIIYRDLKLENVLMDHQGHLALTDFGLSKQNIDSTGGATTFCGTAEYIAPELLKGQKYGPAVDWWSFGILLYEMMHGRTPFYDKNRKLMFYRIINTEPSFPPTFSPEACSCIRGLLRVNEFERLGSGETRAQEIMYSDFFKVIDFDALYRREIMPPFQPEVANEFDTKYVPKAYLQAEAKDSFDEPAKGSKKAAAQQNFEAFTFAGGSALDR